MLCIDVLYTFGFRGEALSALCAVADVTIITKTVEDIVGTSYTMNHDGQIMKHEPCHRSIGKSQLAFLLKLCNIITEINPIFIYFCKILIH